MRKSEQRAEMPDGSAPILENRCLENDYATLLTILKPGMKVLDVGCGTGTMSADIADRVGPEGHVVGLDSSEMLIERGNTLYQNSSNLELLVGDLFKFIPEYPFDLIVSARVLQWLEDPLQAVIKMTSWLKPGGLLSVLDYDHTAIEFDPEPPLSMMKFYDQFLKWRADAGMSNTIANQLPQYFETAGLAQINSLNASQKYIRGEADFVFKAGIWADVAASRGNQLVKDGYLDENLRLRAIEEYKNWVDSEAQSMKMKLMDVRGMKER